MLAVKFVFACTFTQPLRPGHAFQRTQPYWMGVGYPYAERGSPGTSPGLRD